MRLRIFIDPEAKRVEEMTVADDRIYQNSKQGSRCDVTLDKNKKL